MRQSSAHQVLHNRESSTLQYAMRDRLMALGWSEIEVLDAMGSQRVGPLVRRRTPDRVRFATGRGFGRLIASHMMVFSGGAAVCSNSMRRERLGLSDLALKDVCAGLPDRRKGQRRDGEYSMADIGLSAFSVFFMGSPSFLAHQRALEEGQGRSNCQTLFGMTAIPSDAYIRLMLDGASPWHSIRCSSKRSRPKVCSRRFSASATGR